jgi:hypothetical protein
MRQGVKGWIYLSQDRSGWWGLVKVVNNRVATQLMGSRVVVKSTVSYFWYI